MVLRGHEKRALALHVREMDEQNARRALQRLAIER
jgi:hypothetical protein